MKKKLLPLLILLTTFSLASCASNPTSNSENTSSSTSEEISSSELSSVLSSAVQKYDIVVEEQEGVTITPSKRSAEEGETITITVEVTDSHSALEAVKVNDYALTYDGTSYSFIMPKGTATITVEVSTKTYQVINNSSDYCYLIGLEDEILEGDKISFEVALKPGYYYTGVYAYTLNGIEETSVTLAQDGNAYSFTMPDRNVYVSLTTDVTKYQITREITGTLTSTSDVNVYVKDSNGVIYTSDYVPFGDTVTIETSITTSSSKNYKNKITGISFDGKELPLSADGKYQVIMPSHPAEIEVTTAALHRNVTITDTDNVSAYIATSATATEEEAVTELMYGTTYYVIINSSNGYGLSNISATYLNTSNEETNLSLSSKTVNKVYSFTCPAGDVTITLTEQDLAQYASHSAVGNYIGFELYNSAYVLGETPFARKLTISSDAIVTGQFSGSWTIVDDNQIKIHTSSTSYKTIDIDGNALFTLYSSYNSDVWVFTKVDSLDGTLTAKSCFAYQSNKNWATQLYINGEAASAFACIDDKIYLNVTFEMIEGTAINDTNCSFKVNKNGSTIATLTKTGSTIVASYSYHGTYTGSEGDLVLSATGATLNGSSYTYEISGSTVTLDSTSDNYVIVIDETTLTYTVTSHTSKAHNVFTGYKFTGTYYDKYDKTNNSLTIEFGSGETITGTITIGSYPAHPFGFTAILEGNVLTITITSEQYSEDKVGKVITAEVGGKTITFTSDFGTNVYSLKDGTVTCSTFPGLSD